MWWLSSNKNLQAALETGWVKLGHPEMAWYLVLAENKRLPHPAQE
jgi:hypothetical protein